MANNNISTLNHKKDIVDIEGRKEIQKDKQVRKESEPDKWTISVNNLGWFIGSAILITNLVWWFFGIGSRK